MFQKRFTQNKLEKWPHFPSQNSRIQNFKVSTRNTNRGQIWSTEVTKGKK